MLLGHGRSRARPAKVLRSYTAAFDPGFIALRGVPPTTQAIAREFEIQYAKVPTGASSYTMDHTALTHILEPDCRLHLAVRREPIRRKSFRTSAR